MELPLEPNPLWIKPKTLDFLFLFDLWCAFRQGIRVEFYMCSSCSSFFPWNPKTELKLTMPLKRKIQVAQVVFLPIEVLLLRAYIVDHFSKIQHLARDGGWGGRRAPHWWRWVLTIPSCRKIRCGSVHLICPSPTLHIIGVLDWMDDYIIYNWKRKRGNCLAHSGSSVYYVAQIDCVIW